MDYEKDVLVDAVEFLQNHEDDMKEAIVEDTEFSDICDGEISEWMHTEVTDRSYTLQDAAYVIDNCENEETDSGLWEGLDARAMMSAIAAYSYSMDVWFKAIDLYDEIKQDFEDHCDDQEGLDDRDKKEMANDAFKDFRDEHNINPIVTGGEGELYLLEEWVRLGNIAGIWGRGPLGSSYIDIRCGTGHGIPHVKDFVDFDHEIRYKLPHMQGKYIKDVEARIEKLTRRE